MTPNDQYSIRQAAEELEIESWRAARLARYLKLSPSDRRIPRAEVLRIKQAPDPSARYDRLRVWLLENGHSPISP